MAPIVLDSDDDDALDSSGLEDNAPPPNPRESIELSSTVPNGTSSSERLYHDLRSAHLDLLNATPAAKKRGRDDPHIKSCTPDAQRKAKRTKHTNEQETGGWSGKVEIKVPPPPKALDVNGGPSDGRTDLWDIPDSPDATVGLSAKQKATHNVISPEVVVAAPDIQEGSAITTIKAEWRAGEVLVNPRTKRKYEQIFDQHDIEIDELSLGAYKEAHRNRQHHSRSPSKNGVGTEKTRSSASNTEPKSRERTSKRTKVVDETTLKQDIINLKEMGFRSSQAESALKLSYGNVEEAIERLFSMPQDGVDDQVVHPATGLSERIDGIDMERSEATAKTGENELCSKLQGAEEISYKVIGNEATDADESKVAHGTANQDSEEHKPPNVASRGKRGRGRPKTNAKSHDACDSKAGPPELAEADGAQGSARAKKRGRGRPKKLDTSLVSHGADQEAQEAPSLDEWEPEQQETRAPQALEEVDINTSQGRREEGVAAAGGQPVAGEVSGDNAQSGEGRCGTPPGKEVGSPSKQHSPVRAAGVRFKVGLSKKARIEPLLRMVKR